MSQRHSKKARRRKFKVQSLPKHLQHINVNAAGIDIGAEQHLVAVPEGRDEVAVRQFGTFTADLQAIARWLRHCGVTTVALESTGVYWIPLYDLLQAEGFEVFLVDPRQTRRAPGRPKTDKHDCMWIQRLHGLGLLTAAFRPDEKVRVWRSYQRHRANLIGD